MGVSDKVIYSTQIVGIIAYRGAGCIVSQLQVTSHETSSLISAAEYKFASQCRNTARS